ncbi:MAG: ribosome small subunit-dependent GTPase A [Anaerolineales bacterium]|jgi:ribosome biogenesis GTPase|nr:ribosome small subunit-dependent GTPase A [Anaerolineales bacterium]
MTTSHNPSDSLSSGTAEHQEGVVYKKNIGNYIVCVEGHFIACEISSRLRKQLIYPTASPHSLRPVVRQVKAIEHTDPIAIGDHVRILRSSDGSGLIVQVLPRRNQLSRPTATPMPGAHAFEQVIAANIDQMVAIFAAAQPAPKWGLLDRYLVSAESVNIPALICLTKLDLIQDSSSKDHAELMRVIEEYRQIGYPLMLTSSFTGQGLNELKSALKGRISLFIGKSGVGKTSLLNAVQPGLGLRVGEVSRVTGKGRHTTSHLEMFSLDMGGALIDTPGMREFGLWGIENDDLALLFPEMRPYVGRCKFGLDCQHDEEPGCAIRKAVLAGHIPPRRYQSYLTLKINA